MPDMPSPGEVAYDAFWQAFTAAFGTHSDDPWDTINPGTQRAWEAAAQAVREDTPTMSDTPITDQLNDILLVVGTILHHGTQQDLYKLHLWLADYAEVVTTRQARRLEVPPCQP